VDAITGEGLSVALVCAEALGKSLPRVIHQGGAEASFQPYLDTHRREFRRYATVAHTVLWFARHPKLRRATLATLRLRPEAFSWLLAKTVG